MTGSPFTISLNTKGWLAGHGKLPPATTNYYITEEGTTLPHLTPSAGLYLSYAHRPLQLYDKGTSDTFRDLVGWQLNMDLVAAIGLFDRLEIGLAFPLTLTQDSDDLAIVGREAGTTAGTGIGDLRLIPKVRLFTAGPLSMGLALPVSFPTGNEDYFLGDRTVTITPKLVASIDTRFFDAGLNAGYRIRGETTSQISRAQGPVVVDDELVFSLGLRVHVFLIKNGIDAGRLTSQGFGKTKPIASNRTGRGRGQNRRVEFIITDPKLD